MIIKDTYTACSIVENFDGKEHKWQDEIRAWAYLIKTGACWKLQGWYGRNAQEFIDDGFISKTGRVQWKAIQEEVDKAYEQAQGHEFDGNVGS